MVEGPKHVSGSPREKALAGFAALLTEAPWTVTRDDFERLRAVGLADEALVQVVNIASFFNYVTRVADATGIEFDYESPLPRLEANRAREPLERPSRDRWPSANGSAALSLSLRPATGEALSRWRDYVFGEEMPLSARERRLLAFVAARETCDAISFAGASEPAAESPRERALAAFSEKLTRAPWQQTADDLEALRRAGLAEHELLAAVGTVALQNLLSRTTLALAAS